jgi:HEAT repeat protein
MRRPDPIEQALHRLSALRRGAVSSDAAVSEIKAFLKNRSNLVVSKAAKVASEMRATGLVPDLMAAFQRFMKEPHKLDKGCAATAEIIGALYEMDHLEPEVYLAGIRHVQMEGAYGPPVDAAAKLRGVSALGLARTRHPHALEEIVSLLVDRWPEARVGAIRALAANGGQAGMLLLRFKVLTGESEPDVLGECFGGLLSGAPETSLPLIAGYIDAEDLAVAETALLALGSSRLPAALHLLKERWTATRSSPLRKTLLLAIAMVRSQDAIEFLLSLFEESSTQIAKDLIAALALFRSNENVRNRLETLISQRTSEELSEAFRQQF